jgi:hypothetical protein
MIAESKLKTALGVPAAAHNSLSFNKSSSMNVSIFCLCPTRGIPPIAKPVTSRVKSASALTISSPAAFEINFSLARLIPLARTRIGLLVCFVRKIRDLMIYATSHPIAFAASSAVRVLVGSSTTSASIPFLLRTSCTLCALLLNDIF